MNLTKMTEEEKNEEELVTKSWLLLYGNISDSTEIILSKSKRFVSTAMCWFAYLSGALAII